MKLTNKTIKSMLRKIYDNRNSFQGLFAERKALTKLFYSGISHKQCEKLWPISHYINRKLSSLNETIVAKDKSYLLTKDVEFHSISIFGAGEIGLIHKGAIVKILEVYNDKIVVGCENEALDVPFVACLTPNHANYNESTFKKVT